MATVFLASARDAFDPDDWWTDFPRLRRSALTAPATARHRLTDDPESADLVLFADSTSRTFADVRGSALYRRYATKAFVYSTRDYGVPVIRGVFTCAEKSWNLPGQMRAGHYIKVMDHDFIRPTPVSPDLPYLCSFVGSFVSSPVRNSLMKLAGPRVLVRDTSNDAGRGMRQTAEVYERWLSDYARTLSDSIFVLCPRGYAPSSYRLFEAMRAGRPPVIIADEWVPPVGPEWERFAIFVPEASVERIPAILAQYVADAERMGAEARHAWEQWFSPEASFQSVVDWCLQLSVVPRQTLKAWLQILRRFNFKPLLADYVYQR
jgi:Exostosin family